MRLFSKVWLYTLEHEYLYSTGFPPKMSSESQRFECQGKTWLTIFKNGAVKIAKGYSWDGCTPKLRIGDAIIGTFDGPLVRDDLRDETHPQLYYPSLVHDALCQFQRHKHGKTFPYTRKQIDDIFLHHMQKVGFPHAKRYYFFVRAFALISFKR